MERGQRLERCVARKTGRVCVLLDVGGCEAEGDGDRDRLSVVAAGDSGRPEPPEDRAENDIGVEEPELCASDIGMGEIKGDTARAREEGDKGSYRQCEGSDSDDRQCQREPHDC